MRLPFVRSAFATAALLVIAGCGGGGGGASFPITPAAQAPADPAAPAAPAAPTTPETTDPKPVTLSGIAATGAPVANSAVAVQCVGGKATTASTDSNGAWSVSLTDATFPCLVTVSGGSLPAEQSLYSVALDASAVNVTPLTSLVVASAAQAAPSALASGSGLADAAKALEQGLAKVNAILKASGYAPLAGNPLTASFSPVAGDLHDDLIAQLMRSLADENTDLGKLLTAVAAAGDKVVQVPLTHVFKTDELAAMPQLNKAKIKASGDKLSMQLEAGASEVGAYVGSGTGNKAVLQLPGLAGQKLIDFKDMSMEVKGATRSDGKNVYAYVNFMVDLECKGEPLAANATLADVRKKRRIVIFDPFYQFVQKASTPISDADFSSVKFEYKTPGWRISAGDPVGDKVAINPDYIGSEDFETFNFVKYPNACIVDGISGDGGMFRDNTSTDCQDTTGGLGGGKPATCGKAHSGAVVVLGESGTAVDANWQIGKIRFNGSNARNFRFQ
ncbi:hypothetical protein QTH87_00995 [Variovorax sp. J22P168]|uniref:hypothetical protein n=1 Tax=Variovorax jilinensis TaxID=3053513 RepID=UPI0025750814|nr:hypothetical protein [Variovorax sp. J22P168]MDM0011001.1 hypothetical protein [Variovorax sp. J22P168]